MSLLIGEYTYAIDEKNRLNIPAKFRKNLPPKAENTFVVTKGNEKCLDVYPLHIFIEKYVNKYDVYLETDPVHRYITSKKGAESDDSVLDNQGRIIISKRFLDYAGISKDVIIVGAFHRIELWNPDARNEYMSRMEKAEIELEKDLRP